MRRFLFMMLLPVSLLVGAQNVDDKEYVPMLENGKEWRYITVFTDGIDYPDLNPEWPRTVPLNLKIDGTEVVDGMEYHKLNLYSGEEMTPNKNNPVAYLREDVANKKVWTKINAAYWFTINSTIAWMYDKMKDEYAGQDNVSGFSDEYVLYDFMAPEKSLALYCEMPFDQMSEVVIAGTGAKYRGVRCVSQDYYHEVAYDLVEGLGLLKASFETQGPSMKPTFMGMEKLLFPVVPDEMYWWYLSEITDGDGTVIYHDPDNGWASIRDITAEASVSVSGREITVSSKSLKADATLYTIRGAVAGTYKLKDGVNRINALGMAPGVYILSVNGLNHKIVVR